MEIAKNRTLIQVSASLDPKLGGPHSVVAATQKYLRAHFDLELIVFGSSQIQAENVRVIPTFKNNRYGFSLRRMQKYGIEEIRNSEILLLHGFYLYSTLISIFLFTTKNIYLMPHGSLEQYQEKRGRIRKYLFRQLLENLLRGRKIHFLLGSESEKVSILAIYPEARITVVGLGIDSSSNEVRTKDNLSEPIKLFCLSRISEKKRIDLCIKALHKLNEQKIRYTLQIIGSGDIILERELRKLISELNLDKQVIFSGFLEGLQKTKAIAQADIFLLPSENENFALAVAESISAGKPVVVSKFVAMHEFVDLHQTGITINSLEVEELSAAIESVHQEYSKFQQHCIESSHLLAWEEVQKNWLRALNI